MCYLARVRGHAVLGVRDHMSVGTRRLGAVLVAAACVVGSARLWSDALTPAAVPFVQPLASGSGLRAAAEPTIVVAAPAPRVSPLPAKVAPKAPVKAVPVTAGLVSRAPRRVTAPAPASAAPAA